MLLLASFRFATSWFMTLYARDFSFDLSTRVWEIFLSEGFKVLYRVAIALLKVTPSNKHRSRNEPHHCHSQSYISFTVIVPVIICTYYFYFLLSKSIEKTLLRMPFEEVLMTLRGLPATVDAPTLIDSAMRIPVKRRVVEVLSDKVRIVL